jgi:hypothetical protein
MSAKWSGKEPSIICAAKGVLPKYEADDGPLSAAAVAQIRKTAKSQLPKGKLIKSRALTSETEEGAKPPSANSRPFAALMMTALSLVAAIAPSPPSGGRTDPGIARRAARAKWRARCR